MSDERDTRIERTEQVDIEQELRKSYLDYAMSVIIGRALPDVRDGLKPVHRRVLYGMWESGNRAGRAYKKSARIVGDVMGKYHPHGDQAIYDALVRLAQDFSLRFPLVDGQGNFGSVDGDPAAAMRYTEARMTAITAEILADIDKDTVDFVENYDGTRRQPEVLPAKLPNLLINGSAGIAVGMNGFLGKPHTLQALCDVLSRWLTETGSRLARIPLDPRLGRMLIEAGRNGCLREAMIIVAAFRNGETGLAGLIAEEGIGKSTARAMAEMIETGRWSQLERLRGTSDPETLFTTLPGVSSTLYFSSSCPVAR